MAHIIVDQTSFESGPCYDFLCRCCCSGGDCYYKFVTSYDCDLYVWNTPILTEIRCGDTNGDLENTWLVEPDEPGIYCPRRIWIKGTDTCAVAGDCGVIPPTPDPPAEICPCPSSSSSSSSGGPKLCRGYWTVIYDCNSSSWNSPSWSVIECVSSSDPPAEDPWVYQGNCTWTKNQSYNVNDCGTCSAGPELPSYPSSPQDCCAPTNKLCSGYWTITYDCNSHSFNSPSWTQSDCVESNSSGSEGNWSYQGNCTWTKTVSFVLTDCANCSSGPSFSGNPSDPESCCTQTYLCEGYWTAIYDCNNLQWTSIQWTQTNCMPGTSTYDNGWSYQGDCTWTRAVGYTMSDCGNCPYGPTEPSYPTDPDTCCGGSGSGSGTTGSGTNGSSSGGPPTGDYHWIVVYTYKQACDPETEQPTDWVQHRQPYGICVSTADLANYTLDTWSFSDSMDVILGNSGKLGDSTTFKICIATRYEDLGVSESSECSDLTATLPPGAAPTDVDPCTLCTSGDETPPEGNPGSPPSGGGASAGCCSGGARTKALCGGTCFIDPSKPVKVQFWDVQLCSDNAATQCSRGRQNSQWYEYTIMPNSDFNTTYTLYPFGTNKWEAYVPCVYYLQDSLGYNLCESYYIHIVLNDDSLMAGWDELVADQLAPCGGPKMIFTGKFNYGNACPAATYNYLTSECSSDQCEQVGKDGAAIVWQDCDGPEVFKLNYTVNYYTNDSFNVLSFTATDTALVTKGTDGNWYGKGCNVPITINGTDNASCVDLNLVFEESTSSIVSMQKCGSSGTITDITNVTLPISTGDTYISVVSISFQNEAQCPTCPSECSRCTSNITVTVPGVGNFAVEGIDLSNCLWSNTYTATTEFVTIQCDDGNGTGQDRLWIMAYDNYSTGRHIDAHSVVASPCPPTTYELDCSFII